MTATQTPQRVALVTGGASGIGRSSAQRLAQAGWAVVVSDTNHDLGTAFVGELTAAGHTAAFVPCNVADEAQVRALIDQTVALYGRLDAAFNNAGISGPQAPTADYPVDGWQQVLAVNLTGVFLCMKYELPHLLATGGAIVNNASILGAVGFAGAPAYVAAKHGVVGLTQTAATEYAPQGVRINAVCPGFVETPLLTQAGITGQSDMGKLIATLHPIGRMGQPEEIADVVYYLCAQAPAFLTGQAIYVDGGYTAR